MKVPVIFKVVLLILLTTAFYTWVGQLVPQKEVAAPEIAVEFDKDITTEELVEEGRKIAEGKGLCLTCHTIGKSGSLRFPDLADISTRAATRIEGMSQVQYLAQSLYDPDDYLVPGFNKGMPAIGKPPIGLIDDEVIAVIAWLQSIGGTPDVTLETDVSY
jgi:cytochrome c5